MTRIAQHPIDSMFTERWSPRAFDAKPISHEELATIFEAGRWAPSSYNVQPWRFLYAMRDTPAWATFFGLCIPFNQEWVKNTSALVVIVSDKNMPADKDGNVKPSHSHSFDAGSAWAMMALQATKMGLHAHGMTGFDIPRAAKELAVPDTFRVEMMFAVGHATSDLSALPASLAEREKPSDRKPLAELAFEGSFRAGTK